MTHSPEPWTRKSGWLEPVLDANGNIVVTTEDVIMQRYDLVRAIACVNACKGVPTEDLQKEEKP